MEFTVRRSISGGHKTRSPLNAQTFLSKLQKSNEKTPSNSYRKPFTKSAPYNLHSRTRKILTNSNQHNQLLGRSTTHKKTTQPKLQFRKDVNKTLFPVTGKQKLGSRLDNSKTVVPKDDDVNDPYGVCEDDDDDLFPSKTKILKTDKTEPSNKENYLKLSQREENNFTDNFVFRKSLSPINSEIRIPSSSNSLNSKSNNNENSSNIFESPNGKQQIALNVSTKTPRTYSNRKTIPLKKSKILWDVPTKKVANSYRSLNVSFDDDSKEGKENIDSAGPVPPHLVGFPNFGNTCYLNAVMQSLVGLPSFTEDYRELVNDFQDVGSSIAQGVKDIIYNKHSGHSPGLKKALRTIKGSLEKIDESFSGYKMQDANEFLTRILDTIKDEIDNCSGSCSPTSSLSKSSSNEHLSGDSSDENVKNTSQDEISHNLITALQIGKTEENNETPNGDSRNFLKKKNPVKNNFEFQLLESYRCLGCNETEGRLQEYFGLYVNLPSNTNTEDVSDSIQEAIRDYMKTDERELTCEKCGHDKASVVTTFTSLPRILVIQLKRYEFKPDVFESIKVSSNISINKWLSLDPFTTDDVSKPSVWSPPSNKYSDSTITTSESQVSPVGNDFDNERSLTKSSEDATISSVLKDTSSSSSEITLSNPSPERENQPSTSSGIKDTPVQTKSPVDDENPADQKKPDVIAVSDNEDTDLQEAMKQSLKDMGHTQTNIDNEDDDLQHAIKLSLIDMGMCFDQEVVCDSTEDQDQAVPDAATPCIDGNSYRLVSIISHFGQTTTTGHYVSDVYNYDRGEWYHYDDELVTQIAESSVLAGVRQKNGYIFFYVHRDLFDAFSKKIEDKT